MIKGILMIVIVFVGFILTYMEGYSDGEKLPTRISKDSNYIIRLEIESGGEKEEIYWSPLNIGEGATIGEEKKDKIISVWIYKK